MKILLIVLLSIIALLLLIVFGVGFGLFIYVIKPKRFTHEECYEIEKSKDFLYDSDDWKKEELNITLRDGYVIHGLYLPLETPSNKYAIITHGYTYTWVGSFKYAKIFKELGYNVYVYDLRHHGYNENTYCTMGYKEGLDVVDIYNYFREKYGKDAVIGLHGESMGCASSIRALEFCPDAAFLIADCGFADFNSLAESAVKYIFKLPGKISHLGSFWSKVFKGFRLDSVRPIDAFKVNTTTPVFFIHGLADKLIDCSHSQRMFDACQAKKKISFYEGADHAESFKVDRERYRQEVKDFVKELGK